LVLLKNEGLAGNASPAVVDNTVIVSYSSGEVYAMRVENGRVLWTDTLNRQGQLTAMSSLRDIDGHPIVYDGNVYLISQKWSYGGRKFKKRRACLGAKLWLTTYTMDCG
jgi:outer membrane protein assembly factor BamB